MTDYLVIRSNGEIEPEALSLMGASSKRGTDQIGFFGSGNKYAIATLTRKMVPFWIFSGVTPITVTTRETTFRSQSFHQILINGEATSLTTDTGPKWEVRDAIREIWSNARDEGDEEVRVIKPPHDYQTEDLARSGKTTIIITMTPEVQEFYHLWDKYFLPKREPIWSVPQQVSIYRGFTGIYRRGVWIVEDKHGGTPLFTWDFFEFDLPESRKVEQSSTLWPMSRALRRCDSQEVWREILIAAQSGVTRPELAALRNVHAPQDDVGPAIKASLTALGYEYIGDRDLYMQVKENYHAKTLWVSPAWFSPFERLVPAASVHKVATVESWTEEIMPAHFKIELEQEVTSLAHVGIRLPPWKYVTFTEPETIAQYLSGTVLLSEAAFAPGQLRKALLEEYVHHRFKTDDHTVEHQHAYLTLLSELIDKVLKS